ncbi:di-heme oxidoredictase family protein, partial [Singulisphaera rosea]
SEFATLSDFVKAACANELGLSNPGRPQATPLGKLDYQSAGTDLTDEQCVMMTDFIRDLPTPKQVLPESSKSLALVTSGKALFEKTGCADCHSEKLGPIAGIYSDMLLHDMGVELESSTGYYGSIVPQPAVRNDNFAVSEQPTPAEWRTAPLWGVADSGPYLHDGRAATLEESIELHSGEAIDVAARFKEMPASERSALVAFLKTLRAPSVPAAPTTLASK